MYTIYVKFKCLPTMRLPFVERMRREGILTAIREEDGCLSYNYYFSEEDENELLLIEKWESKEHQKIHVGQPHMEKMREFKDGYISETILGEFTVL